MPLLYYWRSDNYRNDLDMGAGYHLNQGNPLLHSVDIGESLWAFTRNRQKRFVLAAELVVRAKTINSPKFRYGKYRVWGDLEESRYFLVDDAPSIEQIIRSLSCRAKAAILSQSFQGFAAVRQITSQDHDILAAAARGLPLEPRARILPEERLEAALLLGNAAAVESLIQAETSGMAETRRAYLYRQAVRRNRDLVRDLQERYDGRCQICDWDPRDKYGVYLCEGHHIQWLSRGGDDDLENMMLVCPNHHSAIHRRDAVFDYADASLDFMTHREQLVTRGHL
jgi:5-methylcytosine-specific restriction enzyme A